MKRNPSRRAAQRERQAKELEDAAHAVLDAVDEFGHVSNCSPPVKRLRRLLGVEDDTEEEKTEVPAGTYVPGEREKPVHEMTTAERFALMLQTK